MSNRTGMFGRPAGFATTVGVLEPIPAGAIVEDDEAFYGGSLFFHSELGRAGCSNPECGWSGVPTSVDGVISTWCPKCQPGRYPAATEKPGANAQRRKAERNAKRHARRKARKKGKR